MIKSQQLEKLESKQLSNTMIKSKHTNQTLFDYYTDNMVHNIGTRKVYKCFEEGTTCLPKDSAHWKYDPPKS